MPSVSRETVIAAVSEYGLAWTTQDPERIGRLFTEDAVYVERAFDRKATFRGRSEIEKYWTYQVCGKQSNICFRHVESEMVRDADRPIAVVKWLAEFDNRREKRVGDKSNKRVRFCQMAKLFFDGTRIAYLEEYVQGMGGSAVRWPGLQATDEELWAKIRFDPEKARPPVRCERCSEMFPSRTKLFGHLRETQARGDGKPGCMPNAEAAEHNDVLVCFSLAYSCKAPEEHLVRALEALAVDLDVIDDFIPTLRWAVPPDLTSSAVINVAAAKLP
jgi:ketosteroid isomerase-like protein